MNGRDGGRPKVPQKLVDERRERLRKFVELRAPEHIVVTAAALYLGSFEWSWREWWSNARLRVPRRLDWLLKLVDRDYAALARQCDEMMGEDENE